MTTLALLPGTTPPTHVLVAFQSPPAAVLVNKAADAVPVTKSPNAVSPVACVEVEVTVPVVGPVQTDPAYWSTMNAVGSAPTSTSLGSNVNVAL